MVRPSHNFLGRPHLRSHGKLAGCHSMVVSHKETERDRKPQIRTEAPCIPDGPCTGLDYSTDKWSEGLGSRTTAGDINTKVQNTVGSV